MSIRSENVPKVLIDDNVVSWFQKDLRSLIINFLFSMKGEICQEFFILLHSTTIHVHMKN